MGRGGDTHGVESAEALVLDDAARDGEGTAGGAELKANLRDERGADGRAGQGQSLSARARSTVPGAPARARRRGGTGRDARVCVRTGATRLGGAETRASREGCRTTSPEARETNLDDVEGLDDAGGAHAGEAAVHERLDRLPGGVIGERHGVERVVGFVRLRGAGVTRDSRCRCVIATVGARSAGCLQQLRIPAIVARTTSEKIPARTAHLIGG